MARFTLLFAVAGTPLLLIPDIFLGHDVIPKVVVILGAAALLLFNTGAWSGGLHRMWKCGSGRALLILAMAQALSLGFSTVFSPAAGVAFAGTVWRRFGAAEQLAALLVSIAAAAMSSQDPKWRTHLLRAMSAGGTVAACYGILQYFGVDPLMDPALYTISYLGSIVRPPGTMGHAIYFAAWLVPVVLVALGQTGVEPDRRWNRIHALAAATGSAAIFFSGTRGALAGLMVGGVLVATKLVRTWPKSRRLRVAALVLGGVGVLAAIVMSPAGEQLRHRWQQWGEDPGGPRTRLLQEAPSLIAQNPGLGTGPDTFAAAFRRIESAEMSRTYPDFYHETPHNALLDAACSQGIPGLLVLCGVFGVGFWRRRDPDMLAAAVVGILITSLFASFSLVQVVWLWTLAGVRVSPESQVRERAINGLKVPAALLGGTFVVVAAMLASSDGAWARLGRAARQKDPGAALRAYEAATTWGAGFAGYELYASRELASLGTSMGKGPEAAAAWSQAAVAAERAEKQGEEPFSAAYQSAVLAITRGDLELSERKTLLATRMAPNWYKPYLLRAQLMAATGRQREAAEQQSVAIRLGAPQSPGAPQ